MSARRTDTEGGDRFGNFVDVVQAWAAERPGSRAYLFLEDGENDEVELDFAAVGRRSRAVAAVLQEALGERACGARVLLLFPSGLDLVTAFFGCLHAGAIAVPTTPPRPNRSMERTEALAGDSGATVVLTLASVVAQRERLVAHAPALGPLAWIACDELADGLADSWRGHAAGSGDVAFLQYTSGSTGTPKGVVVTHANLMHNQAMLKLGLRNGPHSRVVSWLPLHHDMGLIGMVLQSMYLGVPCTLLPPATFLARPLRWLQAISRQRGTVSGGPDFAYDLCVRRIPPEQRAKLDLSSWHTAIEGAEPVRLETLRRFHEAFAPCGLEWEDLYPGYGLAEGTLMVSGGLTRRAPPCLVLDKQALDAGHAVDAAAGEGDAKHMVGCGVALPGQEIAIVEPRSGDRQPDDRVGEIWLHGESVAAGYWRRPEESAGTFAARIAGEGERAYLRTGDLGFLRDGELFVTGRIKDLIVLRGQNHYPQDLERCAEAAHGELRPSGAAAFAFEEGGVERLGLVLEVERRRVADADGVLDAVRRALAEAHEVEPAALSLIRPGHLPRTTSGKVRRDTTRRSFLSGDLPLIAEWRAPREVDGELAPIGAPAERTVPALRTWLSRLVAAALGVEPDAVDPGASLAALGLDSLRTVQVAHRVEEELGVALPLSLLFQDGSLDDLAGQIAQTAPLLRGPAPAADSGPPVASQGQRSLWFLQRVAPGSAAYHLAVGLRSDEWIDPDALRRALVALVDRHAVLRTTLREDEDGEPRPVLHERLDLELERVDARGWNAQETRRFLEARARRPFDLARDAPLRALHLALDEGGSAIGLIAHHVALDEWSFAVLLRELGTLLSAPDRGQSAELPPPSSTHAEFARSQADWLGSPASDAARAFWRAKLDADVPAARLSADRPVAPCAARRGGTLRRALPGPLAASLRALAAARGATPFAVCLAAFELLVGRLAGLRDFTLGTLSSGRAEPGTAGVVGYLVNPLVLRADLRGDPTFGELLERVRRDVAGSLEHGRMPLPALVEFLRPEREEGRTPWIDLLFAWQHAHRQGGRSLAPLSLGLGGAAIRLGETRMESIELDLGAAQFDLSLTMAEDRGELLLALEHDAERFDSRCAERFADHYQRTLEAVVERPDLRASRVSLLGDVEREELLELGRGRPLDEGDERSLPERVACRAEEDGAATAIAIGAREVSRAELVARVERLTRRLHEAGVGPEDVVAIHAGRSLELVVAQLAVLTAGAAWQPLDPELPLARRELLLGDGGARLVLARAAEAVAPPAGPRVLPLDEGDAIDPELPRFDAPRQRGAAASAAYVLHTSGSTGRPKGVVVERRALRAHVRAAIEHYGLGPGDALLAMAPVGFDLSVEEVFPTLAAGARLVLRQERAPPAVAELHAAIEQAGVTVVDLPTAYWHEWVRELEAGGAAIPRPLRLVIVGGERASASARRAWRRVARSDIRWVNTYGPTEATVTATIHDPSATGEPAYGREIPIGGPFGAQCAVVLEPGGDLAPIGLPGELLLGGAGVARGYAGRPALTAERFVPDPTSSTPGARLYRSGDRARWLDDGQLEFLGRRDEQVKIRGYRVEPGEVVAEIERDARVSEAAVVCERDGEGRARLVSWYVPAPGIELAEQQLLDALGQRLPAHLVPARAFGVARLPRSATGKIDRAALPRPVTGRSAARRPAPEHDDAERQGGAPTSEAETVLARLFAELLGLPDVDRGADFFRLGGDSIQSIQLAARASRAGFAVTPQDVFRTPRLADLARTAGERAVAATPAAPPPERGPVPLTPIQRWFFEQNVPDPHHWNQSLLLEHDGPLDPGALRSALETLVRRHDALRLRFSRGPGGWRARVVPAAPEDAAPLEVVAAGGSDPEGGDAAFARACERAQRTLHLERGPLLRGVLVPAAEGRPGRLLLTAHHLVVDAVSWRILVDELEALLDGQPLDPQVGTWSAWARWVDRASRATDLERRIGPAAPDVPRLPRDGAGGPGTESRRGIVRGGLDADETRTLVEDVVRRSHASVEELLVGALARSLAEASGATRAWIEVEGHGRERGADAPDTASTLGWFTTTAPVLIELTAGGTPGADLRSTKRALRVERERGAAWSLLRHGPDPERARALRSWPRPELLFNFLGRFDGALGRSSRLRPAEGERGTERCPDAPRGHLHEIDARIERGELRFEWTHGRDACDETSIERLAARWLARLRELLVTSGLEEALSPSDFPLARLDQPQLDRVLAGLAKARRSKP